MENVDKKNQVTKKRGRPHDEGFAARKHLRKARMAAHGFTYRSFSAKYGFSRGMINAAINETRESDLALLILRTINSLPLPGEGYGDNSSANREI